jgi:hypothetical protein
MEITKCASLYILYIQISRKRTRNKANKQCLPGGRSEEKELAIQFSFFEGKIPEGQISSLRKVQLIQENDMA